MRTYRSHLACFASLAAIACASDSESQKTEPSPATAKNGLMSQAADCADVAENLKAQYRAELLKAFTTGECGLASSYTGETFVSDSASTGSASNLVGVDDTSNGETTTGVGGTGSISTGTWATSNGSTSTSAGGSSSTTTKASTATAATQTNVQVEGIDEGDIVKTDGKNLYVLHDQALELVAASTSGKLTSSAGLLLEGTPREMYVVGGAEATQRTLVVISEVYGPEVYARAGVAIPTNTPAYGTITASSTTSASTSSTGTGIIASGGSIAYVTSTSTGTYASGGAASTVPVAPAPQGPAAGVTVTPPNGLLPMTKITLLAGTDTSLTITSQAYYDGQYRSSRREGQRLNVVFGIDKQWPTLASCPSDAQQLKAEMVVLDELMDSDVPIADVPAEKLAALVGEELVDEVLEQNPDLLSSLVAANYQPHSFVVEDGTLTPRTVDCALVYLPKAGSSVGGVTYVESIDLTVPMAPSTGRAIVGQASLMYENQEALLLATNTFEWNEDVQNWGEAAYVHRFNVDSGGVSYATSGTTQGRIKDQFSLDVSGDDLRIMLSAGWGTEQKNRLAVLRTDPDTQRLATVGQLSSIGDGEDVKAVRFLGDTAYVVTYIQTDPLFVIDVADGTAPQLLGTLSDIPGFSTYLYPMDSTHLLTVGQDASTSSPMVQIFDVTNPSVPTRLHALSMSDYGSSLALDDYKAFTYYPEQQLLAIPYLQYNTRPLNAMLLFHVAVEDGISLVGQVDGDFLLGVPPATSDQYCYYWGYWSSSNEELFSRSVFFDDILFAVAQHGIASVNIESPDSPIDQLVFNGATSYSNYYCETTYGTGGTTSWATGGTASWETAVSGTSAAGGTTGYTTPLSTTTEIQGGAPSIATATTASTVAAGGTAAF